LRREDAFEIFLESDGVGFWFLVFCGSELMRFPDLSFGDGV